MMFRPIVLALLLAVFSRLVASADEPKLKLTSPLDYQVFQRQNRAQGAILVAGRAEGGTTVEVRLPGQEWQSLPVDAERKEFQAARAAPAGGWYKLEVRLVANSLPVAEAEVPHVGVGEVFIVAGQSDSCNYGSEKQKTAGGKVASFDGARWALAEDPEPGGGGKGGSFMPAFGDALAAKYGVPIGVAPCGLGATSVRQWLPKGTPIANRPTTTAFIRTTADGKWEATGEPFAGLMRRVERLGPHGLRAILWHQGESDAGQARSGQPADRQITGQQYRQYLEQLIRASRTQAGWEIPWFVAQATYHSEQDPADEEFRAAQKAVCDSGLALLGPDTDSLRKEFRAGVHFNARGLQAHGKLWADKVGEYLDKVLANAKN